MCTPRRGCVSVPPSARGVLSNENRESGAPGTTGAVKNTCNLQVTTALLVGHPRRRGVVHKNSDREAHHQLSKKIDSSRNLIPISQSFTYFLAVHLCTVCVDIKFPHRLARKPTLSKQGRVFLRFPQSVLVQSSWRTLRSGLD